MAKSNAERSEKAAAKRKSRGEVEIRFHTLPATRQALAELMAWSGIEEQGEAITLIIHHLHGLGPGGALPLIEPQLHVFEPTKKLVQKFRNKSLLAIQKDPGDEIIEPE